MEAINNDSTNTGVYWADYFDSYNQWLTFIDPAFGLTDEERDRIERSVRWTTREWKLSETEYLDYCLDYVKSNRAIAELAKSAFLKLWFTVDVSEDFGYRLHSFIIGGLGDVPSLLNAVETWAERQTWTQRNGYYWMPAKIIDWLKDNTELQGTDLLWALKRVLKAQRTNN